MFIRLISSCTGDARDSIKDCIMASSPEAGYFEAHRILEMNYGQDHAIVEAYIANRQSWASPQVSPQIRYCGL